ncbi:MAG: hypothetical protein ABSD87_13360 [Candidatus Acidiferrales bacterium]
MGAAHTGTKWLAHLKLRGHETWVYVFPAAHLVACGFSYAGAVVPALRGWAISFTFIFWSDWPVSAVPYVLGWTRPGIAEAWIILAGTVWWFLIACGIEWFLQRSSAPLTLGRF